MKKLWFVLVLLRFLLVLIPQTGYLHPDEFFQSIEVVAGDVLDLKVERTWEFNRQFPIRSLTIPYLTIGLPLALWKSLFGATPNPYWLLVLPRLVMACLSLVQDYALYQLCRTYKVTYKSIIAFSLSWVCLVCFTRTLGNAVEAALTSYLLCKVGVSLYSNYKEQKKYKKDKSELEQYRNSKAADPPGRHVIGLVLAFGFFNRPTFLCFAFSPVLFWLTMGLGWNLRGFFAALRRAIGLINSFIITSALLIAFDTFGYHNLTIGHFQSGDVTVKNFLYDLLIITPVNFIRYNLQSSNLAIHGIHPRWLHAIVNIPLLFGVIGLFGYIVIIREMFRNGQQRIPIQTMMLLGFLVPLATLSLFPHQEPRFLLPLFLPLLFLCASSAKRIKFKTLFFIAFLLHNVCCFAFFGFLHQGGVVPCLMDLNHRIRSLPAKSVKDVHIVFSHTYMPPRFLLAIPKKSGKREVFVNDFGGQGNEVPEAKIKDLLWLDAKSTRTYFVLPSNMKMVLSGAAAKMQKSKPFQAELVKSFYPHVATEGLPSVLDFLNCWRNKNYSSNQLRACFGEFLEQWKKQEFTLELYRLKKIEK